MVAPQALKGDTHTPIRRTKRGWCVYCSSTKRNTILDTEKAGPSSSQRKHMGFFGYDTCDVPLCREDTGRDCWVHWHNSLITAKPMYVTSRMLNFVLCGVFR